MPPMTLPLAFIESPALRLAYCVALHGCALLILGTLCLVLRWPRGERLVQEPVWGWLGVFAVLKGLGVAGLIAWGAIDRHMPPEQVREVYLALSAPAYGALVLVGMAGWWSGARRRGGWLVQAAALLGLGIWGWRGGWFPEVALAALATLGAGAAAWVLVAKAGAEGREGGPRRGRVGLGLSAGALAGLGLLEWGGAAYSDRFQGWTQNTLASFHDFRLGDMLAGTVLAWAALGGWWMWARSRAALTDFASTARRALWVLPAGFMLLVGGGFFWLNTLNRNGEERVNEQYRIKARLAALALADAREPDERAAVLAALQGAMPELQAVVVWRHEDGRVVNLASSTGVALPEKPTRWSRGGAEDTRFEGAEVFISEVMADGHGTFELASAPTGDGGERVALRVPLAAWEKAKGPVMAQATIIIVLVALLGIAVLVFVIERDLARSIQGARHRAEAESAAKSEFLAYMSHELRTPLQSVLGFSDLLLLSPLSARQRHHAGSVREQGAWLLRLVNDLLDLAAIRAGRLRLGRAPFAAREWFEAAVDTVRPAAAAKGLALKAELAPGMPERLVGDAVRLRQVLVNLLGNAVKFTVEGQVRVALGHEDGKLRIDVADTGPGIAEARLGRLFQPFERLDGAGEGTGLGLSLVQRLCEAMGGRVEARNVRPHGMRFSVSVPSAVAEEPESARRIGRTEASSRALRVLVVDDHPMIRELLVALIGRLGHPADAVANGRAALEACVAEDYDAVVLDLRMPGMDGIETGRRILATNRGGRPAPRLIGLSAEAGEAQQTRARAAGFEVFLAKPVGLAELAAWLPPAEENDVSMEERRAAGPDLMSDELRAKWREARAREEPALLARLLNAAEAGDWEAMAAEAHRLKNAAWADADYAGMELASAFAVAAETRDQAAARRLAARLGTDPTRST